MRRAVLVGLAILLLAPSPVRAEGRVLAVTDLDVTRTTLGTTDDAGSTVFAIASADPLGTNPELLPQLFAWDAATGAATQITAWDRGVRPDDWGPSVSDDGVWVAVVSSSDPLGTNAGHHDELFLVRADGTETRQLTTLADPAARIDHFALAGSGNRLVFESNADPFGNNPARYGQLFVVDADGTGLGQITSHGVDDAGLLWPSISDDGSRIAYESSDGTTFGFWQVFAILADGTGRRQIADIEWRGPGRVEISGDGSTVAFETVPGSLDPPQGGCFGSDQIAVVDWDGTGLHMVTGVCLGDAAPGQAFTPTTTDDGQTVFYVANEIGTWNVWRVPKSGFPSSPVTEVEAQPGPRARCLWARAAGSGAKVAFRCRDGEPWGGPNPDLSEELYVVDGDGLGARQLTETVDGDSRDPDVAGTARRVAFVSDANPTAVPGYWFPQVYVVDLDGTDLARLTDLDGGAVRDVSIDAAATTIVFAHDGDPVGENVAGYEVFAVETDGSGLRQLTPDRSGGQTTLPADRPHQSADGTRVVLQSRGDLLDEGLLDESWRVYAVAPDGTGLTRLSDGLALEPVPRVDAGGTWVVYVADGDVRRNRFDGGLDVAITSHGDVRRADVAPGGDLVVYAAAADPLGTNTDLNVELFLRDVPGGITTQLTDTPSGGNHAPAFSDDGAWVHFWSDAPHFGEPGPAGAVPYRVRLADGTIERTAGLATCGTFDFEDFLRAPGTGNDGDLAVFAVPSDCDGTNPEGSLEVFALDRTANPRIRPGKADPTVVTWDVESGPARYDVVRGDLAALATAGDTVDLGAVTCIENDSEDAVADPDPADPAPGQTFFFLYRGTQGPTDPGTYGTASDGRTRTPASGDCAGP